MKTTLKKCEQNDYIRIRDFLISTYKSYGKSYNWLIDRWNFVRHFSQIIHDTYKNWLDTIGVWEDENGEIVAVVCSEGEERAEAFFQLGSMEFEEEFLEQLFDFAEENLMKQEDGYKRINLRIAENAVAIENIAKRRGYELAGWREIMSAMELSNELPVVLPKGFRICNGSELSCERQGMAHAKAFGYIEREFAKLSPACYKMLRQAPDYNEELDFAVVNQEGEIVSFCTIWHDKVNNICILEPVGTHPEYRKMGLGKAVIYHGLNKMIKQGVTKAFVGNDQEFYKRIGLMPDFCHNVWEKTVKI